jgi:hypothetical protein
VNTRLSKTVKRCTRRTTTFSHGLELENARYIYDDSSLLQMNITLWRRVHLGVQILIEEFKFFGGERSRERNGSREGDIERKEGRKEACIRFQ